MNDTKSEILALLKRNGGRSVNQLADALELAPITIRQHLTRLERDGLLISKPEANGNGRPHYLYRLSAKAEAEAFPYRSDRIVELLIKEVGHLEGSELVGLSAPEKTVLVLDRLAGRLAREYAPIIRGWALQERVVFVTEVLRSDGGFAEWEKSERGFEIRDYNCLFHRLMDSGECKWHRIFLAEILGDDVRVETRPGSENCCSFAIETTSRVATLVNR